MAEFTKARGTIDESAFAWWVSFTVKKKDVIISKVKARLRKTTHKYGIEILTSVKYTIELDRKNENQLWQDIFDKEMFNVGVAFKIMEITNHSL